MSEHAHTNRLSAATSPYLKQHAHNPVDWFPWGPEALNKAREQDRPIFLSIGYSACHWCHVMEHESFEDDETAAFLNEHFVSIKVDREERPDLDHIYMTAVQMMTGQGGWPMSVFLTPDLRPFYGGTYFPPEPRYGRPSFLQVLNALVDAWGNRREQLHAAAGQLTDGLKQVTQIPQADGDSQLSPELLRGAMRQLQRAFDSTHGGFGSAPKFPHPMELQLLLRIWLRLGADDAAAMAKHTLDKMAMGGIYDHLGGGFHRYSTDARWLVPHFEKMLYDNALLTVAYLEGYQATRDPFYKEVVEETLAYVRREMRSVSGPFFSTQDADSEGEEGKFFVWTLEEIEELLGAEEASLFAEVYDVTADGNWEGHNILNRSKTFAQSARLLKLEESELRQRLDAARKRLFDVRCRRIWPGRDEKVLTAWNGLMINAFARAARVLDDPSYAETAAGAADFILKNMRGPGGRLLRTWSQGSQAALNAYQVDYAYLIDALVSLFEATFDARWLDEA
ncbi:MAG: thioredoxin domain-containing protein, partial [Gemmataceae bacterium]